MAEQSKPQLGRRSFLNWMLGIGTAVWIPTILYPLVEYFRIPPKKEEAPSSVVAAKLSALKPNQGVIFKFGSEPGILILGADGVLRAFSAVCTHLQCTVHYRPDLQKIHCACHNGLYDLSGRNIAGPPPRPLPPFKVVQRGDDIVVSRA